MKIHIPETTITIPRPRTILQFTKWAVLPLFALILALSWGGDRGAPVSAQDGGLLHTPDGGAAGAPVPPDFHIQISNLQLQNQFCSSQKFMTPSVPNKCLVEPGSKFLVDFVVSTPGDLLNTGGYDGFFLGLSYSSGLTRQDLADECAIWPDGTISSELDTVKNDYSAYTLECQGFNGNATDSVYVGELAHVEFGCSTSQTKETVTVVFGTEAFGDSLLGLDTMFFRDLGKVGEELITEHNSAILIAETLQINCEHFFPWDVTGISGVPDGSVTTLDIFEVAGKFGATKPVCC